jgi:putative ATP-dependent endonuclease of OLD family
MYLSKMTIENFRGISSMSLSFNKDINILIGENGSSKSTIIDAIRILYNLGEPLKEITIKNEDFNTDLKTGESQTIITISYEFRGLSEEQKGALYEYLVIHPQEDYAHIKISFEKRKDKHPKFDFYTGAYPGQRASVNTFEIFQHYYLGALRDSTSDLLSARRNLLGRVIKRNIEANSSEQEFKEIISRANSELLKRTEVSETKSNINNNLLKIYSTLSPIGLHIEQSKLDYIVNVIKPYLPFTASIDADSGLNLFQNSLGYNNLIYIATVLSDMNDRVEKDSTIHHALLIEEPEAHLHPQLQLNLYNFLKERICNDNCQLFLTTHSPTLTSKSELDKLFVTEADSFKCIGRCFVDRENEKLIQNNKLLNIDDFKTKRKMLERYIDVTKSQMFYAKSLIFVEGISEELLLFAFAKLENFRFEELDIEVVQTGTSFYPFLLLFNSTDPVKKINKRVAVITDDDRFTDSKNSEYSFSKLIDNNYFKLDELYENVINGEISNRIGNLINFKNNQDNILISAGFKTFEYELSISNIGNLKSDLQTNYLFKFIQETDNDKYESIQVYLGLCDAALTKEQQKKIALLLWKSLPKKSEFSQDFSEYLLKDVQHARMNFIVPQYIKDGFEHLKKGQL